MTIGGHLNRKYEGVMIIFHAYFYLPFAFLRQFLLVTTDRFIEYQSPRTYTCFTQDVIISVMWQK